MTVSNWQALDALLECDAIALLWSEGKPGARLGKGAESCLWVSIDHSAPPLQTKLYIPPLRPDLVPRPHQIEQLDAGLNRRWSYCCACGS